MAPFTDNWYLTVSPDKEWGIQEAQFIDLWGAIVRDNESTRYYGVIEHGDSGQHPHIHVVFNSRKNKQSNIKSRICTLVHDRKMYDPRKPVLGQAVEILTAYPNLLELKKAPDLVGLIGGYFQMERTRVELGLQTGFDVQDLIARNTARSKQLSDMYKYNGEVTKFLEQTFENNMPYLLQKEGDKDNPEEREDLSWERFDRLWMQIHNQKFGVTSLRRYRSDIYMSWLNLHNVHRHVDWGDGKKIRAHRDGLEIRIRDLEEQRARPPPPSPPGGGAE